MSDPQEQQPPSTLNNIEQSKQCFEEADRIWAEMRKLDGFFQYIIGLPSGSPEFDRVKEKYEATVARAKELDPDWRLHYD